MDSRDGNLLGALASGVQDAVHEALAGAAGLDSTAVAALLVVRARPGQSITDLAAALRLTHSGAVRSVNRLASQGLVARDRGRDGRSRGLVLTSEGFAVSDRALAARRTLLEGLLECMTRQERASLIQAVERVLGQLPGTRTDAWRICRTCEHEVCRGVSCPVGSAVSLAEAGR